MSWSDEEQEEGGELAAERIERWEAEEMSRDREFLFMGWLCFALGCLCVLGLELLK